MPLNIAILLLLVAILLFKHKPSASFKCLTLASVMLILTSISPVANWVMKPLEQQYESFSRSSSPVDYIVVLGCGHTTNPALPATSQLKDCSLRRLVEGVRILNIHPEAQLITSGYSSNDPVPNAEKVKQAAMLLGVPESKILTESFPKDTKEESELIAPRVQGKNVVLVTDADHLPRAMKYFEQQGVSPIPAPAGFWVKNSNQSSHWSHFVPSSYRLTQTSIAWYETLGKVLQWLTSD